MRLKILFLAILGLSFWSSNAQDFHNTYYQFAPVVVNPAFTGAFYGNMRINAIGRNQGRPIASQNNIATDQTRNEFNDISLTIDGNIPFGLKETDWVSAGINYSRSRAGAGGFQRAFSGISLAYHYSLNKEQTSVFTIGAKYGTYSTQYNGRDLIDPFGLEDGSQSADLTGLINQIGMDGDNQSAINAGDLALGVMLTTPVGDNADIRIGLASDHLLAPRLRATVRDTMGGTNPINQGSKRLNRRYNAFIQYFVSLNDNVVFNPTLNYFTTDNGSYILMQSLFSLLIDEKKEFLLNAGFGVRLNDSMDVPLYLGADWKTWRFGLSYDTNVTGLTQENSTFGALELAVSKIINWEKKAAVKPKFVCPRL